MLWDVVSEFQSLRHTRHYTMPGGFRTSVAEHSRGSSSDSPVPVVGKPIRVLQWVVEFKRSCGINNAISNMVVDIGVI